MIFPCIRPQDVHGRLDAPRQFFYSSVSGRDQRGLLRRDSRLYGRAKKLLVPAAGEEIRRTCGEGEAMGEQPYRRVRPREARREAASTQPARRQDHSAASRDDRSDRPVPTPDEIQAFVSDNSPTAYEKVVDRLLASPAYGERWGRHWLDVARYADSDGFKADETRPNIWRYRDYVIEAFNEDKPYDRFIREQIAGDELYPGDPDALVAMGFNRHWIDETNAAGLVIRRQETLDDITNVDRRRVPWPDHRLRPLPRPQVRSDSAHATTTGCRRSSRIPSFGDGPMPLKDPVERQKYEEQIALWEEKTKDDPRRDEPDRRAARAKRIARAASRRSKMTCRKPS